eukprot:5867248-Pleurochrysis_carterae.AAC.1
MLVEECCARNAGGRESEEASVSTGAGEMARAHARTRQDECRRRLPPSCCAAQRDDAAWVRDE